VTLVEGDGISVVMIESTLVFRDGGTNEVLMLGFQEAVEFLRGRSGIVFDVEEIREFGGS